MNELLKSFLNLSKDILYDREEALTIALSCLLAKGHLLIEDLPGVGKTSFALLLAQLFGLSHRRIQMTNDLLPGDVIGANIFNMQTSTFQFRPGPMFTNLLLVDELNRASPRTQSAFLEAMEEKKVTIDGVSHQLPDPFFVIATQNPNDQAGTSPLPEGQIDRFLVSMNLGFPTRQAELKLLQQQDPREKIASLPPLAELIEITKWQQQVSQIHVSEHLAQYAYALLQQARNRDFPLSPRSGQHLIRMSKAMAWLRNRDHALPEDIQTSAPFVWSHRLNIGTKKGRLLIDELISTTQVPS